MIIHTISCVGRTVVSITLKGLCAERVFITSSSRTFLRIRISMNELPQFSHINQFREKQLEAQKSIDWISFMKQHTHTHTLNGRRIPGTYNFALIWLVISFGWRYNCSSISHWLIFCRSTHLRVLFFSFLSKNTWKQSRLRWRNRASESLTEQHKRSQIFLL